MPDYEKLKQGYEDLFWDTNRNGEVTNRKSSTGGIVAIKHINADHIPVLSSLVWDSAETVHDFLVKCKAHYDAYTTFSTNVGHWAKFLGFFADSATLIGTYPTPDDDAFAWVQSTKTFWHWDEDLGTPAWADSHKTLSDETSPTLGAALDTGGFNINFGSNSGIVGLNALDVADISEKTIGSGSITVSSLVHSVDTETDASEDMLTSMVPASNSDFVFIKAENSARTVIIEHSASGTNKFILPFGKDIVMRDNALYLFYHNGTNWNLVFSSANENQEGTLVDGANIDWDLRDNPRATVELGGNRTLNAPTNMEAGGYYMLRVVQDSTGGRTLTFNPVYYDPASINLEADAVTVLYFYSDGTNMYGNAIDPEAWVRLESGDYTGVDAFDCSTAGSTQTQAVSGENGHTGIFFSTDGSKVFLTGETLDAVREFDLSTPFDVSTISAVQYTFSTTSETLNPQGVCFTSDGTKMYIAKESTSTVFQYDLSTAWDLSTASYSTKSYTVNTDMGESARDIDVKPDGSKIYVLGASGNVYEWDLTSGDISTASYVQSYNPSEVGATSHGFAMASDGTKMLISAASNGSFYEYSLSTPFDISTASYTSVNVTMNCNGLCFSSDGFRVASCSSGNIYDKPLGTQNVNVAADKNYIVSLAEGQHTLPDTPQDGTRIKLRRFLSGSNHPTAVTQGSDTFDDASTTLTLDTDKETTELIYNATTNEYEVY